MWPPMRPSMSPSCPHMPPARFTCAVIATVRLALSCAACAAVIFPAVTAASIFTVASATRAAMSASFLAPAIVANDSPAAYALPRLQR